MVEAMLAIMMLAVGFIALLSLSNSESQRTDISRQRLLADQALRQLREALGEWTQEELLEFPASLADFTPLHASRIEELPGIAIPENPERAAIAQAFETALKADTIERVVVFRPSVSPEEPGFARFIVRYPGAGRVVRTLETSKAVYD